MPAACLRGKRFLLHDRDPRFTDTFADTLSAAGVETVRLPPRSPNLNAYAERFVRTIKESCLDQLILVGKRSLRNVVHEFVEHYHHERNHQGMSNRLLFPVERTARGDGRIACRARLARLTEVGGDNPPIQPRSGYELPRQFPTLPGSFCCKAYGMASTHRSLCANDSSS